MQKNVLTITHSTNARIISYYLKGKPENYDLTRAILRRHSTQWRSINV